MSEATNEIKKATKIFMEMEMAYKKFRRAVGEIAEKNHANPYEILISFLDASLADERKSYKEVKKNIEGIPAILAKALGVKLEDLHEVEIGDEEMTKIISALSEHDDGDDDEEEELDF